MAQLVYSEKQYYLSKRNFHFALAFELLLVVEIVYQISINPNVTITPRVSLLLASSVLLISALLWFLHKLSLKIKVTNKGISFRMKPFQPKQRKLKWDEIANCKMVSDPNLLSWNAGMENSWQEKKFTLNARHGISLVTVHGERIFIGSPNLKALADAIENGVAKHKAKPSFQKRSQRNKLKVVS
jgi:hypothetical protein